MFWECDIIFKSVDKVKKDIEDSAEIADSDCKTSKYLPLTEDISPTVAVRPSANVSIKLVILILFKKFASAYVSPSRNVSTVTDLYDETL